MLNPEFDLIIAVKCSNEDKEEYEIQITNIILECIVEG